MKLFNKQAIALLICVITISVLCVTSVSYAFFTAKVTNSGQKMSVQSGTMQITYTDSNAITLDKAIPGDSVTKQFRVYNNGTLPATYNIKLNITTNTFGDKADLKVTLKKKAAGATSFTNVISSKNIPTSTGYILKGQSVENTKTDTYELTILFNKDTTNTNQNDNAGKKLVLTVEVDSAQNPTLASGY